MSNYDFPRVIIYIFAHIMVGWGFGVGVLDWVSGVGLFSQLMVFWACGVGPSGFFGVGAFYLNIEE
mgnify:CR=1 FL=1